MLWFIPDQYLQDSLFLFCDNGNYLVIPIFLITRTWDKESQKQSSKIFPVLFTYAITIYNSQGLTLKCIVIDISKRDFQTYLTYVRISRVKELRKIIFDHYFNISHFIENPNNICQLCIKNQIKKSKQILFIGLIKEVMDN